jgi:hypothetical protein
MVGPLHSAFNRSRHRKAQDSHRRGRASDCHPLRQFGPHSRCSGISTLGGCNSGLSTLRREFELRPLPAVTRSPYARESILVQSHGSFRADVEPFRVESLPASVILSARSTIHPSKELRFVENVVTRVVHSVSKPDMQVLGHSNMESTIKYLKASRSHRCVTRSMRFSLGRVRWFVSSNGVLSPMGHFRWASRSGGIS